MERHVSRPIRDRKRPKRSRRFFRGAKAPTRADGSARGRRPTPGGRFPGCVVGERRQGSARSSGREARGTGGRSVGATGGSFGTTRPDRIQPERERLPRRPWTPLRTQGPPGSDRTPTRGPRDPGKSPPGVDGPTRGARGPQGGINRLRMPVRDPGRPFPPRNTYIGIPPEPTGPGQRPRRAVGARVSLAAPRGPMSLPSRIPTPPQHGRTYTVG